MIYFDFDGVIRDLIRTIPNINFTNWDTPIEGKSFVEYFENNLDLLESAPPTEYYPIIWNYCRNNITIMTNQQDTWKKPFWRWMHNYFPNRKINVIFVKNIKDKLNYLNQNDLLVDDYPKFDNYSQIILIKKPYNNNINNAFMQISQPEQLQQFLLTKGNKYD